MCSFYHHHKEFELLPQRTTCQVIAPKSHRTYIVTQANQRASNTVLHYLAGRHCLTMMLPWRNKTHNCS